MGPIALFDKSFLQALSVDESVWFDHFFYPNVCPLFYVETLADLTKTSAGRSGRDGADEVRIIADKTPTLSGAPCVHHRELALSNLMGQRIPMNGQIPMAGGRPVRSPDGKKGVVFDQSPEAKAFGRWQEGAFQEVEKQFAHDWRQMLTELDLPAVANRIKALGIDSKLCKTVDDAHAIAIKLVRERSKPHEQMALLFAFLDVPREYHTDIIRRWSIDQYRPLADYAPYAAHVLCVELFFQIALGANLISAERASNRVDIAYLFYLPFSMVFVSGDRLHRLCARPFLKSTQDFVWAQDLKAELGRQNAEFGKFPVEEREKGLMKFARAPIGSEDDLLLKLWDRHTPGWRMQHAAPVPLSSESERKIVEQLGDLTSLPTDPTQVTGDGDGDVGPSELDQMAISRLVPKKKGSWWLLPKDLDDRKPNAPGSST
ncbi:hypothetical protein WKW77_24865 [Variovorax ureilyticus]|uniref:Uncharacterized protein n=1 Tax=Variovorax ureilyticus TaxID=1836198 RepID=A0ABU8VKY8_9BURK